MGGFGLPDCCKGKVAVEVEELEARIQLHLEEVVLGELVVRVEHLRDAVGALADGPDSAEALSLFKGHGAVVGGEEDAVGRVDDAWLVLGGEHAGPAFIAIGP